MRVILSQSRHLFFSVINNQVIDHSKIRLYRGNTRELAAKSFAPHLLLLVLLLFDFLFDSLTRLRYDFVLRVHQLLRFLDV